MCTLKYRRWNNELRPFQSLKRRVANIFQKQNSLSDDSRGTSTQTIINYVESDEEKSVLTNSKRGSVHSNWSKLLSVNEETGDKRSCRSEPIIGMATTSTAGETMKKLSIPPMKKTVKNSVSTIYTNTKGLGKLENKNSPMPPAIILVPMWYVQKNREKKRKIWSMNHIVHIIPLYILQNFMSMNKLLNIY